MTEPHQPDEVAPRSAQTPDPSGEHLEQSSQGSVLQALQEQSHRVLVMSVGIGVVVCCVSLVRFWVVNGDSIRFGLGELFSYLGQTLGNPLVTLLMLVLLAPHIFGLLELVAELLVVWGLLGVLFYRCLADQRPLPGKLTPRVLCRVSPGCIPRFVNAPRRAPGPWRHFLLCACLGGLMIIVREESWVRFIPKTIQQYIVTTGGFVWTVLAVRVALKTRKLRPGKPSDDSGENTDG